MQAHQHEQNCLQIDPAMNRTIYSTPKLSWASDHERKFNLQIVLQLYFFFSSTGRSHVRNVTGTEMSQKVLSRCMSGIYCMSSYERYMHVLYQVYTWYILFSISIYQVYTWYMTFLLAYTRYIPDIYQVYTWWLMLWRQTWPHAARATSNHITRPCHYCNSFRFTTFAHFTFAHVSVHRPFRHKERRETPFFAQKAHKVFHLGQYR